MSKDDMAILAKVKKLLKLAEDGRGATPAEAATAAAKAQAILLEHNLTLEDVGDLNENEKGEEIGYDTVDLEATYSTGRWHANLLYVISRPLFCRSIYHPARTGRAGKVSLVGKPSNVAVVRYFYGYLYRAIDEMAKTYQENWKADMRKKEQTWIPDEAFRVRMDFCRGAVSVIGQRLQEQYAKAASADVNCRAVAVVSDKALDDAFRKMFPHQQQTTTSRKINGAARLAGQIAGATIPLRSGVAHMGGRKALPHV